VTTMQIEGMFLFSVVAALYQTFIADALHQRARNRIYGRLFDFSIKIDCVSALLEIMKELEAHNRLVVRMWGGSGSKYIQSCSEALGICCNVYRTVDRFLSLNNPGKTKQAKRHLVRFEKSIEKMIAEMTEVIRDSQ
jgi:hypothetical protein